MCCCQVVADIPRLVAKIQEKQKQLRALQGEANEVQAWLETTKELLETQVSPPTSPTGAEENDSVVVDPQVRKRFVPTHLTWLAKNAFVVMYLWVLHSCA